MRLNGRSVLLVEDEFLILLELQQVLEDQGAQVSTAGTVREGMDVAGALSGIDAAVLDVDLPDGKVYALAETLQARGVPIVFHSGQARAEDLAARFPEALALSKPAAEARMIEAVAEAAGREEGAGR